MGKASSPDRVFLLLASGALVIAGLYFGRPLLAPLAVAVLLTFLLAPVVDFLQRRRLLGGTPAALVMLAAVSIVAGVGALVFLQSHALLEQLPEYENNIRDKLSVLANARRSPLSPQAQRTLEDIGEMMEAAPETVRTAMPVTVVDEEGSLLDALAPMFGPLATTGLTLMLTFFMLLQRRALRDRFVHLCGRRNLGVTTRALDEAGQRISRYLRAQGLINLGFGLVVGIGLYALGLDFAPLWGLLAALLRFVPYVGPWVAAAMPITLSLATSEGWVQPLAVLALFATTELAIVLGLEPVLYGRSAGLSPLALVATVSFWTLIWGPIGLFLATPLTACLCVLCRRVPDLAFIPFLLGDEPVAANDAVYYQRLLAHDEDEALQIALAHAKEHPPEHTFETLLLPTLSALKADSHREGGDEDGTLAFGAQATRNIAEAVCSAPRPGVNGRSANGARARGVDSDAPASESSASPRVRPVVLACPAADEVDVLTLELLRRLSEEDGHFELEVLGSNLLASEVLTHVERTRPALVCIGALAPGGLARAQLLCRRLRAGSQPTRLVVGRWQSETPEADARLLLEAGADRVFATLQEARQDLDSHSLIAKPA